MPDDAKHDDEHSDVTDDLLDRGLADAFGRDASDAKRSSESVLESLKHLTGPVYPVHLEGDGGGDAAAGLTREQLAAFRGRFRYELTGEVGRGGMGEVLKGRDHDLGREVAIKLLADRHRTNPSMARRFVEEAQIGGQLQHPGIVPVHELGLTADERPYFTMQLVEGETLADLLAARADPATNRRRFLGWFEKVLETMAYAHSRGVIHRDLKPANIMIGSFGEVQVMDWGLSKVLATDAPAALAATRVDSEASSSPTPPRTDSEFTGSGSRSVSGSVFGTPAYMPPEQARGEVELLDQRADVFSLGAILCEILTGKPPYVADDAKALCTMAQGGGLGPAVTRLRSSGADRELLRIAQRCLMPAREARFRTAGNLAEAFSRYLASLDERTQRAEVEAAEARVKVRAERKARRLTVGLAAAVVLAVVIAGGGYLWVDVNRRGRIARATVAVNRALEGVTELWGSAKAAPVGDLSPWIEIGAALERADAIAAQGTIDLGTRERLEALGVAIRRSRSKAEAVAAQNEKDRAMVARLERVFTRTDVDWPAEQRIREFEQAFRDYGIDMLNSPPNRIAEQIQSSGISAELIDALHYWIHHDKTNRGAIFRIAELADPDPLRARVRAAVRDGKKADLVAISRAPAAVSQRPCVLYLIAKELRGLDCLEDAAGLLTRAWDQNPGSFRLALHLHEMLFRCDPAQRPESLGYLRAALAAQPESSALWGEYSVLLAAGGEFKRAWKPVLRAIELDPHNAEAQVQLGELARRAGDLDQAERAGRAAVNLAPSNEMAHLGLGLTLWLRKRYDDAVHRLKIALGLHPDSMEASCFLGMVLRDQGKREEAISSFRRALNGKQQSIRYGSGVFQRSDNRSMRACCWFEIGNLCLQCEDATSAVSAFEEAVKIEPDWAGVFSNLGKARMLMHDHEGAKRAYRRSVELDSTIAEGWLGLSMIHQSCGNTKGATEALEAATKHCPDDARVLFMRANWFLSTGDLKSAARCLARARSVAPSSRFVLMGTCALCLARGDLDAAQAVTDKLLGIAPDSAEGHFSQGAIFVRRGRLDAGIQSLRKSIRLGALQNAIPSAHLLLGVALIKKRDFPEAERTLIRFTKLCRGDAQGHKLLAVARTYLGDYKGAYASCLACANLRPSDIRLQIDLGNQCCLRLDDPERAAEHYARAEKLGAKTVWECYYLSIGYRMLGRMQAAVRLAKKAVALCPKAPKYLSWLAVTLDCTSRSEEAVKTIKALLAAHPGYAQALSLLGKLCFDTDVARATEALKRAVAADQSNALAYDHLCWALLCQGRFDDALDACRRCNALVDAAKTKGGKRVRWKELQSVYPRVLRDIERTQKLAGRLEDVINGRWSPDAAADLGAMGQAAFGLGRFAAAARLYAAALEEDSNVIPDDRTWLVAIRAAALAAKGAGADGETTTPEERCWACRTALQWLGERLAIVQKAAKSKRASDWWTALCTLRRWERHPDLAGLRDKEQRDRLPMEDLSRCRAFWSSVRALIDELKSTIDRDESQRAGRKTK